MSNYQANDTEMVFGNVDDMRRFSRTKCKQFGWVAWLLFLTVRHRRNVLPSLKQREGDLNLAPQNKSNTGSPTKHALVLPHYVVWDQISANASQDFWRPAEFLFSLCFALSETKRQSVSNHCLCPSRDSSVLLLHFWWLEAKEQDSLQRAWAAIYVHPLTSVVNCYSYQY